MSTGEFDFFLHTDALDAGDLSLECDSGGTLVNVLDRLLDRGVVIFGDLRISVADVDLLFVGVKLFVASVDTMEASRDAAAKTARDRAAQIAQGAIAQDAQNAHDGRDGRAA